MFKWVTVSVTHSHSPHLRLYFLYLLRKLRLAFFLRLAVHVITHALSIYSRCIPPLPTVRRELLHIACAAFAILAFGRHECGRLFARCIGGIGWFFLLGFHTGNRAVDLLRRRCLHLCCAVRVGIDRGHHRIMPENLRQRLDVDSVLQCHRREGVAQIVEADVLASGALEDIRQPLSDGGRLPRIVGIHRRREGHTTRNTLKTVLLLGISFLLLAVESWLEGIVSV